MTQFELTAWKLRIPLTKDAEENYTGDAAILYSIFNDVIFDPEFRDDSEVQTEVIRLWGLHQGRTEWKVKEGEAFIPVTFEELEKIGQALVLALAVNYKDEQLIKEARGVQEALCERFGYWRQWRKEQEEP